MDKDYFKTEKQKAHGLYLAQKIIYNPYFKEEIILNAKGFHHLQFTNDRLRSEQEQLFKFKYLPLAIEIIRRSSTIQEYRKLVLTSGNYIEYFGMVAIIGEKNFKIKAVLKRKNGGRVTFWSVMPYSKIRKERQKIYQEGIEED
jgi:hypothetical protein